MLSNWLLRSTEWLQSAFPASFAAMPCQQSTTVFLTCAPGQQHALTMRLQLGRRPTMLPRWKNCPGWQQHKRIVWMNILSSSSFCSRGRRGLQASSRCTCFWLCLAGYGSCDSPACAHVVLYVQQPLHYSDVPGTLPSAGHTRIARLATRRSL